jgi:hypothetical protein
MSSVKGVVMNSRFIVIVGSIILGAVLVACGGGGGSSSSSSTPASSGASTSTTYTASSGAGEVITFTIDTTNKTYTYIDVQSSYGFVGKTGAGSLVSQNADGSWNLSASSDGFIKTASILANSGGLIVGQVTINYGGGAGNQKNPIFGVSNPISSVGDLAGTYNYISFACSVKSYGAYGSSCGPAHGTIVVDSTGAYHQCTGANIGTNASCTGATMNTTGTITASANAGVFNFLRNAAGGTPNPIGGTSGSFIAYTSSNGQKIIITDLSDNYYGYGHLVGSTQNSFTSGSGDGTWYWAENSGLTGTTVVSGMTFTAYPAGMGTVTGGFTTNANWPGLLNLTRSDGSTGYVLAAGTGLYVAHDNTSTGNYEIGFKKQ